MLLKSIAALILMTAPALAHDGAHLHPHGAGHWFTIVLALALVAGAATFWMMRK